MRYKRVNTKVLNSIKILRLLIVLNSRAEHFVQLAKEYYYYRYPDFVFGYLPYTYHASIKCERDHDALHIIRLKDKLEFFLRGYGNKSIPLELIKTELAVILVNLEGNFKALNINKDKIEKKFKDRLFGLGIHSFEDYLRYVRELLEGITTYLNAKSNDMTSNELEYYYEAKETLENDRNNFIQFENAYVL